MINITLFLNMFIRLEVSKFNGIMNQCLGFRLERAVEAEFIG